MAQASGLGVPGLHIYIYMYTYIHIYIFIIYTRISTIYNSGSSVADMSAELEAISQNWMNQVSKEEPKGHFFVNRAQGSGGPDLFYVREKWQEFSNSSGSSFQDQGAPEKQLSAC